MAMRVKPNATDEDGCVYARGDQRGSAKKKKKNGVVKKKLVSLLEVS